MPKILVAVMLIANLFGRSNHVKLTPTQHLKVMRVQIIRTARIVEKAHEGGIIDKVQYTKSKHMVIDVVRIYNSIRKRYETLGRFDGTEKQHAMMLLVSVVTAIEQKRKVRGS